MPCSTHGVEHGQPSLAFRVEALRGDLDQLAGCRFFPVFAVDIQQQIHPGLLIPAERAAADAREHFGKRGPHHRRTSMAKAADLPQPPVIRRRLERLNCVEPKRFADPVSERRPNARDCLEQGFRARTSLQVLKEVPPAGGQHFGDCAGYGRSDERDRLQRIAPTLLGDSAEIIVQNAD